MENTSEKMTTTDIRRAFIKHIMDCSMLMPIEWIKKTEPADSEFKRMCVAIIGLLEQTEKQK